MYGSNYASLGLIIIHFVLFLLVVIIGYILKKDKIKIGLLILCAACNIGLIISGLDGLRLL